MQEVVGDPVGPSEVRWYLLGRTRVKGQTDWGAGQEAMQSAGRRAGERPPHCGLSSKHQEGLGCRGLWAPFGTGGIGGPLGTPETAAPPTCPQGSSVGL